MTDAEIDRLVIEFDRLNPDATNEDLARYLVGLLTTNDSDESAPAGRPKMEIGNCWIHDHQPNLVHYMLHYTDPAGDKHDRHLVETVESALGKILLERILP